MWRVQRVHGHRAIGFRRCTKVTERKTRIDWAPFILEIAERYIDAKQITLVMDNLNTHFPGALYAAFPPDLSIGVQNCPTF